MKKKWWLLALPLVLILGVAAWATGLLGEPTDPKVAELEQMRDDFFQRGERPDEAQRDAFRDRMSSLTDEQRRAFFERSRPHFQQRMKERMDEFFAKSPEEQREALDKRIDEMLARRAEREARGDGDGGGRGGPGGGKRGWGGGGKNRTEGERDTRRKQRLDRSDPEMRAQFGEFRRMMTQRMEERGVESKGGGWGRF